MGTLARMVSGAMAIAVLVFAAGCNTDSAQDTKTEQSSPPGNRMADTPATDSGADAMLKSLGKGGSGVGAASAAVPENSYVATTNPSSAEEAEKPKGDAAAQPSAGGGEKSQGEKPAK